MFKNPDYPKLGLLYAPTDDDSRTVAAADCLVPGIGGSSAGPSASGWTSWARTIRELGMAPQDYWWFHNER